MSTQQKIKLFSQRWIALGCLTGWLGVSMPQLQAQAQAPQMCIDETGFYQRNQVTVRAQWGRQALRKGQVQPAVNHLAKALMFARTVRDAGARALIFEDFIASNSGSSGWLIHEIDQLVELGEPDAVRTVLAPATLAAQELPAGHSALKIRMLTTIATDYGAIEDQATALALLFEAQQLVPNVQGNEIQANRLTTIAQGYMALGESITAAEIATQALQQAEAVTYADALRRDKTVAPIAVVYAKAGDIDQAMQLAQSIEQPYYRENIIGTAALSAARLGQLEQAANLVQLLTLDQPTVRTLTDIGLYLAAEGDEDQAQLYFDQAVTVITTDGYPGPSFTQKLIKAGFAETVLTALSAAPDGRIKVDGLLDLATHYTEAGNTEAAGNVLRQALAATETIEQDYARNEVLEDMIKRAIELEDYELAVSTIETLVAIKQSGGATIFNQDWAYGRVARAAAQSGQIAFAMDILDRIDPSYESVRRRAWVDVAVAHAKAGDFDAAFAMAERTKEPYSSNYALALVGIGLQQRQADSLENSDATIAQAIRAAEALESSSDRLEALNVIALERVKAGLTATDLLEAVLGMVQEQITNLDDAFTLQTVVTGWVEMGEYDIALRFFEIIAKTQPQNPLWRTLLVDRLLQKEEYARALDVIESRDITHLELDEMLLIAERYFQAGQRDQAIQLLRRVYNASDTGATQLLRIAELYTQAEQTDQILPVLARAFEVAQTIPGEESKFLQIREDLVVEDTGDRGSVYEEIAVAYGRVGAFEQGQAVVQALQDSENRERAMARLNCYRDV